MMQTTTTYQNIVVPDPSFYNQRLETVTPNRFNLNNNASAEDNNGEFKRSASARLHRNKKSYPEGLLGEEPSSSSGGKKKGEQREESMKRLLEWKQRMLQSPLTRKSSRNASRCEVAS